MRLTVPFMSVILLGWSMGGSRAAEKAVKDLPTIIGKDVNLQDAEEGRSTKCLKDKVDTITADEGIVVQWHFFHFCQETRKVKIVFKEGKSPCVENLPQQEKEMKKNDTNFIRCTMKAGAGGADPDPVKYPYIIKGPKNEEDPEIDVPPPVREGSEHD